MNIAWGGEDLIVSPERAVYWRRERTLIIADPHFGKAAAFRSFGIPVPRGTTTTDLERLTALIAEFSAERLVVLGDFFHARRGRSAETMRVIEEWRDAHTALRIDVVVGNHDVPSGAPPDAWRIGWSRDAIDCHPFRFTHEPRPARGMFVMGGHVHPAIRVHDGVSGVRARCFVFGRRCAVLPAFGSWTGSHVIRPGASDRVILCGPDTLVDLGTINSG